MVFFSLFSFWARGYKSDDSDDFLPGTAFFQLPPFLSPSLDFPLEATTAADILNVDAPHSVPHLTSHISPLSRKPLIESLLFSCRISY